MSPNAGGGVEFRGLGQWVQLYKGAQINFRDLTPYLTYDSTANIFDFIFFKCYKSCIKNVLAKFNVRKKPEIEKTIYTKKKQETQVGTVFTMRKIIQKIWTVYPHTNRKITHNQSEHPGYWKNINFFLVWKKESQSNFSKRYRYNRQVVVPLTQKKLGHWKHNI